MASEEAGDIADEEDDDGEKDVKADEKSTTELASLTPEGRAG